MRIFSVIFFIVGLLVTAIVEPYQAVAYVAENSTSPEEIKKAHERVEISNYREAPIILPGLDVPLGLRVSFDVTQKSYDFVALTIYPDWDNDKWPISNAIDPASIGNFTRKTNTFPLQASTNVNLVFKLRAMDLIDAYASRFCLSSEDGYVHPRPGFHAVADIRIGLIRPDYPADIQDQNQIQKYPPVDFTDEIVKLMPLNSKLQNIPFWQNILDTVQQPEILLNSGYHECTVSLYPDQKGKCYCR